MRVCYPRCRLIQPIFRYPMSYMAYHTWAFTGFMQNEFKGTTEWGCPTGGAIGTAACPTGVDGAGVLDYYEIMDVDKWVVLAILAAMAAFYRVVFLLTLHVKERKSR